MASIFLSQRFLHEKYHVILIRINEGAQGLVMIWHSKGNGHEICMFKRTKEPTNLQGITQGRAKEPIKTHTCSELNNVVREHKWYVTIAYSVST